MNPSLHSNQLSPASSLQSSLTVEFKVHFGRGAAGKREVRLGDAPPRPDLPPGNIPRITRLMALAIHCDELIRRGEVADYADLARLGHVTRARMTQIMNLLNLAPDIQEEILFLPRTTSGPDPIREREVRPMVVISNWRQQRKLWRQLMAKQPIPAA
ncbi:MAG: hypothetical protein HJJLKODD_02720 [Phycisphaerae bacterium]|nr:hypothetical protein [Phycisphaerae bacterium]